MHPSPFFFIILGLHLFVPIQIERKTPYFSSKFTKLFDCIVHSGGASVDMMILCLNKNEQIQHKISPAISEIGMEYYYSSAVGCDFTQRVIILLANIFCYKNASCGKWVIRRHCRQLYLKIACWNKEHYFFAISLHFYTLRIPREQNGNGYSKASKCMCRSFGTNYI